MKNLLVVFSILGTSIIGADESLTNYLTDDKNLIFDYEQKKSELEASKLRKSWVSPVVLSYQKSKDKHRSPARNSDKYYETSAFSVGIDQPIFKSGGIYYTIKQADNLQELNFQQIEASKRQSIAKAIEILFNIKKAKLQLKKLDYLIKNNSIEIRKKSESYDAGLLDSSVLNNAIIERNKNQSLKLDIKLSLSNLKSTFETFSNHNPDKIKLPRLHLISLDKYKSKNSDIAIKELQAKQSHYNSQITWSRYLPTVSINARYTNSDIEESGLNNFKDRKIGFTVSMPISINSSDDIESSRVDYMKSVVQTQDTKRTAGIEYANIRRSIDIINKRIALTKKDEKLYGKLYRHTKDMVITGDQTKLDAQTMKNALKIKQLDRKIYQVDKQLELLKLYTKIAN